MKTLNNLSEGDEQQLAEWIASRAVVAVDFWKPDCEPCARQMPIFEVVAAAYPQARFLKVNGAQHPRAPFTFKMKSVPAVMVFSGGERTFHQTGLMARFTLEDEVEVALAASRPVIEMCNGGLC